MKLESVIEAVNEVVREIESYEESGDDAPPEVMERLRKFIVAETQKADAIGNLLFKLEDAAAACELEAKRFRERAAKLRRRREGLARFVARVMRDGGIKRLEGRGVTCTYLKPSQRVEVKEDQLPEDCWRQPEAPAPVPDLQGIKERLKMGEQIPGAVLVEGDPSLRVYR